MKVCLGFNALVLSVLAYVLYSYGLFQFDVLADLKTRYADKDFNLNKIGRVSNMAGKAPELKGRHLDKQHAVSYQDSITTSRTGKTNDISRRPIDKVPHPDGEKYSNINNQSDGKFYDPLLETIKRPGSMILNLEHEASPINVTVTFTVKEARRHLKGYIYEDIMNMRPIRFLGSFKNPCWIGTADNGPINDNKIHCLPYFYIIVVAGYDPRELSYFVRLFDHGAKHIATEGQNNPASPSRLVMGEGTPANLHIQGVWDLLPGNEGLSGPRYTNIDYIKHLTPHSKVVVVFRNPVDRLYSDFLMHSKQKNATYFHEQAKTMVRIYQTCLKHNYARSCIYNHSFTDVWPPIFQPAAGFYAFFLEELRRVFSPKQLLPVLLSDRITYPIASLAKVYEFLNLRPLPMHQMRRIAHGVSNSGVKRKNKAGPMLNSTRRMLNDFYRSSNKEMAKLMNDKRYLFIN